MKLDEAREIVRESALQANRSTYSDIQVDRAIRAALKMFIQMTRCAYTWGTCPIVSSVGTFSIGTTITDFRPERAIRVRMQYIDRGVWAGTQTYQADELVTDGPLIYICTGTNVTGTANEPTIGNTPWRRIATKAGDIGEIINLEQVQRLQGTTYGGYDYGGAYFTNDYTGYGGNTSFMQKPKIAFDTITSGYVYPLPVRNRILWFQYYQPLISWVPGTANANTVTLNIPDEYIETALWFGAPAFLEQSDPIVGFQSAAYKKFQDEMKRIRGETTVDPGPVVKNRDILI